MSEFGKKIEQELPITPCEKAFAGCGLLLILVTLFLVGVLCGCVSEYTGSSTIVGEQLALPEISDVSDSITIRVYETIKGARVWTSRDSKVTITYSNTYTNKYFGIVETQDAMNLKVDIEPLDCSNETEEPAKTDN